MGAYYYQMGEIDLDSAKKELLNGDKISSLVLQQTGHTSNDIGLLTESELVNALNEILGNAGLYKLVDNLSSLNLGSKNTGLLDKIKKQLESKAEPDTALVRALNSAILRKVLSGALEKTHEVNTGGVKSDINIAVPVITNHADLIISSISAGLPTS